MTTPISIIDIFAGPGGLGEGFSAARSQDGKPLFKIKLSIEKDEHAHKTLELRAFYRQFVEQKIPTEYYEYLKGEISSDTLFDKYPEQYQAAQKEAWKIELGKRNRETVKKRIGEALMGVTSWILIGGPPCQAYSLAGRSRMRGQNKRKYREDHRHHLYKEYLQILADHQPPVFVMENVKGLLSSRRVKKENTFDLIISDLKHPNDAKRTDTDQPLSYLLFSLSREQDANKELEPKDFVIRSEEYGIPQARHRVIIFGIRKDLFNSNPEILKKVSKKATIKDVIGDLPKLRSGLSKEKDSAESWHKIVSEIESVGWLKTTPQKIKKALEKAIKGVGTRLSRGKPFVQSTKKPNKYSSWYIDKKLNGICNHESRSHISKDLHRYFFAAVFARVNRRSPTLNDFPKALLPKHKNVKKALVDSIFNDRFRVQLRWKPSTTVVSHISKDGHYYIHYDPSQCRSLTVREAARLQTFPDNYFFRGNRTEQYHQVGNAVPPLLANKIAKIVYKAVQNSITG
jgi:DNA (cytosine-5)-methyltransferase 1